MNRVTRGGVKEGRRWRWAGREVNERFVPTWATTVRRWVARCSTGRVPPTSGAELSAIYLTAALSIILSTSPSPSPTPITHSLFISLASGLLPSFIQMFYHCIYPVLFVTCQLEGFSSSHSVETYNRSLQCTSTLYSVCSWRYVWLMSILCHITTFLPFSCLCVSFLSSFLLHTQSYG